jgi:hypothetical protein
MDPIINTIESSQQKTVVSKKIFNLQLISSYDCINTYALPLHGTKGHANDKLLQTYHQNSKEISLR